MLKKAAPFILMGVLWAVWLGYFLLASSVVVHKEKWPNGRLKTIGYVKRGDDGQYYRYARWIEYHPSQRGESPRVRCETDYEMGVRHGPRKIFTPDGSVVLAEQWNQGTRVGRQLGTHVADWNGADLTPDKNGHLYIVSGIAEVDRDITLIKLSDNNTNLTTTIDDLGAEAIGQRVIVVGRSNADWYEAHPDLDPARACGFSQRDLVDCFWVLDDTEPPRAASND
jgi:hypothetical protein